MVETAKYVTVVSEVVGMDGWEMSSAEGNGEQTRRGPYLSLCKVECGGTTRCCMYVARKASEYMLAFGE